MEFEDFRKAFEAKAPSYMKEDAHFQEYVQRWYEADGKKLTEAQADSYFSGVERGFGLGIYFMADLLVGCAKEGTVVAKPRFRKNYISK